MAKIYEPRKPLANKGTGKRHLWSAFAQVLVLSPPDVPPNSDVMVNGREGELMTGTPVRLSPGIYSFSLEYRGRKWCADREIKGQRPGDAPITVRLELQQLIRPSPEIRGQKSQTSKPTRTIVYVHGIGNKPRADILRCQWDRALFDGSLGDRSRLAYWVDQNLYPTSEAGSCDGSDMLLPRQEATSSRMLARGPSRFDNRLIEMLAENKTQKASLSAIAAHFQEASSRETSDRRHGRSSARVLPGGKVMRRFLADFLTDLFLPDVHGYLFDRERRRDMLDSLRDRLRGGGEPFIIVGHSLGSVIAYDLLRSFAADECNVELFLTIGSPLGMQEIRDHLGPEGPLTVPDCVQRWEDFADEDDLVSVGALLKKKDGLESYYGANARGVDVKTKWIENLDRATNPHSGTGYLKNKEVRTTVRSVTGQAFTSPLVRSTIANNLSAEADRAHASTLHEVLIQLDDKDAQNELGTLKELAEELIKKIRELAKTRPCRIARIEPPERLRRFVVAKLTRSEIESLRTLAPDLGVRMVWSNSRKQALIATSASAVQALPAQISYGASGRGIAWAVLDTGIDEDHPHFRLHRNVQKQWDCLTRDIKPLSGGKIADPNGHGTHVAGIIAGETRQYDGSDQRLLGMAPEAKLYGYRVLGEDGVGSDAAIIRALDHIADQNEKANRLVIHGVNLSLGSSYDPSIYGCGHTPICQELRRLWRQGVVVVLAAGNEGYATFESSDGEMALNLDLSIGDPANLEEAIAVGSVHKRNPHIYGISFFSSRGPTADGRRKPDCVAPGENIVSALTGKRKLAGKRNLSECFVEMSGTSMAAPHVSGVLAGFLSVRAEFIGEPDKVKLRLLETCTDLKRDPNMQGAGLVNLTRMLLAT